MIQIRVTLTLFFIQLLIKKNFQYLTNLNGKLLVVDVGERDVESDHQDQNDQHHVTWLCSHLKYQSFIYIFNVPILSVERRPVLLYL